MEFLDKISNLKIVITKQIRSILANKVGNKDSFNPKIK